MGGEIERPDWGPGGEHRALVPAEPSDDAPVRSPNELLAEMQSEPPPAGHDVSSHPPASIDPIAQLPQETIEAAAYVVDQILGTDPERASFEARFDELSPALQAKVFKLMAVSPHLRGNDLLVALEGKLTLDEQIEAQKWGRSLSAEHRALILGPG